ncbi:MAG: hypothetical protein COT84_01890 [Chlamydiae bacterium CG10_big_fil_rev_8_21_14_0_10_35_9]|nr:MAG: hypothetical protein COT84_01890 [Chlamydiae bacterium CG10_big_fil_rev_8_21_14_0_10_35_9]
MNSEKPKDPVSSLDEKFLAQMQTLSTPEEKLRFCLDSMKEAISQDKIPNFKQFWEVRRLCLPLFKENLSSFVRSSLWNEFLELTTEARKLKEILDEQSSFTLEQIDLALTDLEKDIALLQENKLEVPRAKLPDESRALKESLPHLADLQGEINLFNTLIARQSSLRKELMVTEMRIRHKNKFFRRISKIGDFLFPKRKEIIQQISEEFFAAVKSFVENHFQNGEILHAPYYALKDEVKAIQSIGKNLNLNNKVFSELRNLLSSFWDKLRDIEKDRKKEFTEKKAIFVENKQKVQELIDELSPKLADLTIQDADSEIDKIFSFMKTVELGKEEVRELKKQLAQFKAPIEEKKKLEQEKRIQLEQEQQKKRLQEIEAVKQKINECFNKSGELNVESLQSEIKEIQSKIETLTLSKFEKQTLDRSLKPLKDLLIDLKEKALLNLSEDDLKSLDSLNQVLAERKKRRQDIKNQLEIYRKELGGSGFDFEKAMMYREMIDTEKERLEKVEEGIAEIEEKISEIEGG